MTKKPESGKPRKREQLEALGGDQRTSNSRNSSKPPTSDSSSDLKTPDKKPITTSVFAGNALSGRLGVERLRW